MGCKQSILNNTTNGDKHVSRCKDRMIVLKEANSARKAFESAHSGYFIALKDIGVALSAYGHGEAEFDHDDTVILGSEPNLQSYMVRDLSQNVNGEVDGKLDSGRGPIGLGSKNGGKLDSVDVIIDEVDGDGDGEDDRRLRPRRRSKRNMVKKSEDGEIPSCSSPPVTPMRPQLLPESKGGPAWDYFSMEGNMPGFSKVDEAEADERNEETESHMFDELHSGANVHRTEPKSSERVVASSASLFKLLEEVDKHFLEASQSAEEVAKTFEPSKVYHHKVFADKCGQIDHSARVMDAMSWTSSFRSATSGDVVKKISSSGEFETQADVFDNLLVWEKKVLVEGKATEMMKLEYQRKVSMLNKQKKRGVNSESLEKTKAVVDHLHTRYKIDMQSLDSTVSEVILIRDSQLYPKLVSLVDGMTNMWRAVSIHHDNQLKIATNLKSLDILTASIGTSQLHQDQTNELWNVAQEWNAQFEKLDFCQKQYIRLLNKWLKLNINPAEIRLKEKNPPIKLLLESWTDSLEKLPDDLVKIAMSSFTDAIKAIISLQEEEMKLKEKCKETQEELMRKDEAFEEWHKKYIVAACKTHNEAKHPEKDDHNKDSKDPVSERRLMIENLQKRLEDEVEAHQIHCLHVREKSVYSLKIHLHELFQALSDYARACHDAYQRLGNLSKTRKHSCS